MLKVRYALRHDSWLARSRCESHSTPISAADRTASCEIDGPVSGPPPPPPNEPIGVDIVGTLLATRTVTVDPFDARDPSNAANDIQ